MRYCKLIYVSGEGVNSNKFYEMTEKNSQIEVKYGRVESTSTTIYKPIGQWNSIINEKKKKGYVEVTDFVSVKEEIKTEVKEKKFKSIKDVLVREFISLMEKYTKNLVNSTYSVKPKDVTQKQIDKAQDLITRLSTEESFVKVNLLLIQLYTMIPRKMKNVKDFLLPNIVLEKHLVQEQDNLDAMRSQITVPEIKKKEKKVKEETLLDKMGVEIEVCTDKSDIQYILDQINSDPYKKVQEVFKVKKSFEDKKLKKWISESKNKTTQFLIHGTRCSSVLPIIEQGLKIRPVGNFQFSGKAYGEGNYFSETSSKSLNYTGNDPDKVLFVYEVHTGNPFVYNGWWVGNSFSLTEKNLNERGFDSTFVKAGNGLLNTEIIVYNESQCALRYILWIK